MIEIDVHNKDTIKTALRVIGKGGVIIYPTDTLYGFGVDAANDNAIEKLNHQKVKLIKFPYWYLRIAAKQIILRNIKLSTFIKTIFQFNIIFSIIRNSNFIVKFLVTLESIVNTLWYSFTLTIKPKK